MKKWTQKNLQEEGYKVLNMMVEKEKKEEKDDYTWIPCSVRFPTYRDEYTVTIENFHGERSIDTRFYWGDKNFETAADAQYQVKVVAWVPNRNLEPWKGDAKS